MRANRLFAAAALLAATAAAGCGEKTIDSAELEGKLKSQLGADAGVQPRAVECPEEIKAKKGRKLDCTLTAPNGEKVRVDVTLTNDNGGFRAVVPQQ